MNKRLLSLLLTVAMLLTALVMAVPTAAATTQPLKTKGYLLAVNASRTGVSVTADGNDNGQSTVFLLADGTFIVFDGGQSAADAKHLSEQLHSIAAEHGLSKVVVSMWNFTHPHGDHMGFLSYWSSYASGVEVKEIWYNPAEWVSDSNGNSIDDYTDKLKSLYPNATIKAVHAGDEDDFADVHVKVLWAADSTNKQYYETGIYGTADYADLYGTLNSGSSRADKNNASTVMMLTIGGTKILMAGDAGYEPFENIYNSTTNNVSKADLDCDIFQITHHGVGSASSPAMYSTPNNKHFAAMTPDMVILPAGAKVTNMSLIGTDSGQRADRSSNIYQNWTGATKTYDYDGYYKLMLDYGIVDAAKADGEEGFQTEDEFFAHRAGTSADGKKSYVIAGWLNPSSYNLATSKQVFFEAEEIDYTPTTRILEGAAVRCIPDGASGLRFISEVPAATVEHADQLVADGTIESYSFGTVIFKASSLSVLDDDVSAEALEAAGEQYVDIAAVDGLRDNDDGSKTIFAALVNIKEQNYGLSLGAVSYIEYQLANGFKVRTYAQFDGTKNVRSIAEVARKALADVSDTQTTEVQNGMYYVYKYLITDPDDENYGKYSIYSAAQREILWAYARGANDDTLAGFDRDDVANDVWD